MDILDKLQDLSHKDEFLMAELLLLGERWERGHE